MINKRIMVIGPKGSGKTTLVNYINGFTGKLRKSQDVIYTALTMDVPSGYLEQPFRNSYIISLAQNAWCVLFLVDQSDLTELYSPGFAKAVQCKKRIGIVSKCDLKTENYEDSVKMLKKIGLDEPYYSISIPNNIGIEELMEHLKILKEGGNYTK